MLKFSLLVGLITSGIAVAATNVYLLPEAKSVGVASDDEKAVMFLAVDRNDAYKGVCFALEKQDSSIIPTADISATVDKARFKLHGLRPNNNDVAKELVCILGSEATEFLTATMKSSRTHVQFDFTGDVRKYSFDTTTFSKLSVGDKKLDEQLANDYKNGIRAPVFYNQNHKAQSSHSTNIETSDETNFRVSDQKLNSTWKSLSPDTRKKLLPSQREWIKQKDATCKTDFSCLTSMTNDRIMVIESER
jgi:uncharacterized protein YecT (DUF1311 family)